MARNSQPVIKMKSLSTFISILLSMTAVYVHAFSTTQIISENNFNSHHFMIKRSTTNEIPKPKIIGPSPSVLPQKQQHSLQTFVCCITVLLNLLSIEPAIAAATPTTDAQGITAVTQSSLGTSVRSSVVQSAKLMDAVDLKWERFSDTLRDNKKCDPLTNRRLFDNGFRKDGTPRGNPVLGALCDPVPLKAIDDNLVDRVVGSALADAASETFGQGMDPTTLQQLVEKTRIRVEPAFQRAAQSKAAARESPEAKDEARKRQQYNLEVYAHVRAYGEALTTTATTSTAASADSSSTPAKPLSKTLLARQSGKKLDLLWGRNLLDRLAGPANAKYEFRSPFPKPDSEIPFPYDEKQLTNALGAIEVALEKLQDGGLIGHWEISIPEDDYGEVVTIAIDDDVCLGAQILAQEEQSMLRGSPVVAMVRSALEDRAKIPYAALDVFFIDPTTTKNELYNPTQLLVSVRNLGEEP